jgi:hypothetical protein
MSWALAGRRQSDATGEKLKKLFAMLGQDNDGEFDNARQKVSDMLAAEKRTWKALVDSLFSASSHSWSDWHDDVASRADINPLDLVHHLLQRYVDMTPHQFVAVSLWIAHTFVYQRFTVTPRLMVTSPVRGCGKTTLLDLPAKLRNAWASWWTPWTDRRIASRTSPGVRRSGCSLPPDPLSALRRPETTSG